MNPSPADTMLAITTAVARSEANRLHQPHVIYRTSAAWQVIAIGNGAPPLSGAELVARVEPPTRGESPR